MADVGTGLTIAFSTGFFAEITNVDISGISREAIDISHMGTTTAREFMPSDLHDPGEMQVELAFDPSTAPPINGATEAIVLTFPDGSIWTRDGFMTDYEAGIPLEEKMTGSGTIKFSGTLAIT